MLWTLHWWLGVKLKNNCSCDLYLQIVQFDLLASSRFLLLLSLLLLVFITSGSPPLKLCDDFRIASYYYALFNNMMLDWCERWWLLWRMHNLWEDLMFSLAPDDLFCCDTMSIWGWTPSWSKPGMDRPLLHFGQLVEVVTCIGGWCEMIALVCRRGVWKFYNLAALTVTDLVI